MTVMHTLCTHSLVTHFPLHFIHSKTTGTSFLGDRVVVRPQDLLGASLHDNNSRVVSGALVYRHLVKPLSLQPLTEKAERKKKKLHCLSITF